jgi:hypothetical protein
VVGGRRHSKKGLVVPDLTDCQKVVEWMLGGGRTLAEVEEYIEGCGLDQMEKAGLWMLAWAHQDQATQLRLAKETLALVRSLRKTAAEAACSSSRAGGLEQTA